MREEGQGSQDFRLENQLVVPVGEVEDSGESEDGGIG